jgi:hypothetical protein
MPSLSLNVGLNNGRKLPFGGGAAPSGIPVASTNVVSVIAQPMAGGNYGIVKSSPSQFEGTQAAYGDYSNYTLITFDSGLWTIYAAFLFDGAMQSEATYTASGIAGYIPTSGWTPEEGFTSIEFVS